MHIHVASCYSLRYGVAPPAALAERAVDLGMRTLALTDRDGLYGAVRHVRSCADAGLGAVVGADLRVASTGEERIVVLAEGRAGWRSLCRLVSAAHAAGERGHPVVTRQMVGAHAEGLVVLLGPASDFGRAVAGRRPDVAAARLEAWRATVETMVEIVDHHDRGDGHRAARMLALARAAGVPAVLGNAVRYLDPADHPVAQVLDVTRRLVPLDRRHLDDRTGHAYLKSIPEMRRVAELSCGPDEADALLAETRRLSERCVLDPGHDLGMDEVHLPAVDGDPYALLVARCADGMARRGLDGSSEAVARLDHELGVIARKGLASYFLTVADAAALIRSRGIRCAIRGSGAGSLVNHLLGIGDLDPLRHDLVMERFLADSRDGLPDIDLDVESARRLEAYRALFDRFGAESTACVSMMETYRARSAIRDVGNAIGLPPLEIDAVAKAFPQIRASQIRSALTDLPELRQSGLASGRLEVLFRIAERLDGIPRHIAMHPCGILLSNPTLRDRTPVEQAAVGFPMSQFDKDDVEAMGLLKLDVLGVRMQSAMAHAVAEVARVTGEEIALEDVPRDDPATYELIRTSRTLGCFQIESPGQRELIGRLQPRDLDDLVIDISLFRPGPVNSDMVTPFLEARAGVREPVYPHPDLEPVLRESLGVIVFHEQVLRVIDVMTGCGLSQAEAARRSLGHERGQAVVGAWFREKAVARGYDEASVGRVWRLLTAFGAFGFCKAHAASFALPTYQSAWLKRHHPAAFYAGVLTHDPGLYPKRVILDDARHFGVPILPLDVNRSSAEWHAEPVSAGGPTGIRVALSEVKGISDAEVTTIVETRPYASLTDFWRRARASRSTTERLVLAGAFDTVHGGVPRRDLLCRVGALSRLSVRPAHVLEGQLPLDDDGAVPGLTEDVPAGGLPPMTPAEVVEAELDILGMDVSRHVITFYDALLTGLGVVRATDLPGRPDGSEVLVAGVKVATQTPAVRSGQRVIFATLDDATGPVDLTFFESVQDRCAATVFGSWLLVARGRVRRAGARAVSITADACWDLNALHEAWRRGGPDAVRAAMAVPSPPNRPVGRRVVQPTGFAMSPYSDIGHAGAAVKRPPAARLWHSSRGSTGVLLQYRPTALAWRLAA
ncbi:DNA polymerase III alpha subunit [Actinomadura pelletieri DSM 43383]|uniref:DNA polymerase III subunit alpha n=1 Tax=Actinomadura pelletieri DSM 43383 TaxID=1120940 RepID=A0A495QUK1_9ACTN|nr:DNA polymerase III subunit alpha [Actinomadura pelletieri]RKS77180.1 DNA polymerase III alpha subunit [Actinomadura pelletieri DSM 43383]